MKNKTMLLIILLILLQGCKKPDYLDASTCNTIDCDKFIDYNEELELNIVDEPELNKIITVNAKYNSGDYTGIIDFAIIIPEGYEYVSGNKRYQGFVDKNQVLGLSAKIKGVKIGGWIITAYAQRKSNRLEEGKYAGISTGKYKELPILK